MTVNRKPTGTASSVPVGLVYGVLTSTAVTLILTAVVAKLIDREILAWENTGYAVLLMLLISSWLGAIVTAARIKRQRLIMCLAAGGTYFGILMIITALFFGGKYSGVMATGLLVLCGSLLGAISGSGRKNTRKVRIKNR